MMIGTEEQERIRLISDTVLYPAAVQFIVDHRTLDGQKQMHGLLVYARVPGELMHFVNHQSSRNWTGKREHYGPFYQALKQELESLRRKIKAELGFIPNGLTKREERVLVDDYFHTLAGEFIQHLVAEDLWQEAIQS